MKLLCSIGTAFLLLTGCASLPEGFSMYPKPLQPDEEIPTNMAVILVGVSGPASISYLQFGHSSMPAINARFPAKANTVVPIAIPVGIKQLSLSSITMGGQASGYSSSGTSYGYIGVHTPKLNIEKPGLYYIATLQTDNPGQYQLVPIPEQLKEFRSKYQGIAGKLEPINFGWPN